MSDTANAASVAILNEDRVLLIRRARAPMAGLWTLPGGRCEPGETAAETATRELREELGVAASGLRPLTRIVEGEWRLAVFIAAAFTGDIVPSDEVADWRWVGHDHGLEMTPGLADVLRLIPGLA